MDTSDPERPSGADPDAADPEAPKDDGKPAPTPEDSEHALLPDEADVIEHAHFDMLDRETTQPVRRSLRYVPLPEVAPSPPDAAPSAAYEEAAQPPLQPEPQPQHETAPPRAFEPAPFTVLRPTDRPVPSYLTSRPAVRPEPVAAPIQQPAPEPEPPVAPEPVAPEPVAATLVDDGVEEEAPAAPQTETPEQVVEWREPEMVAEPVEIAATQPEPPPATRDYQPPAPPAEPIVPPAPEPESVTESVPEAEPPVEVRPAPPTQRYDAPPPPAPQVPPPTPEPEFVPELAQALRSKPPPAPPSPPPFARHSARPEPNFDPPRREPRFEPRPTPAATPAPTRAPTFETASPPLSAYDSAPHQPAYVEPDAAAHQPTTWRDLARRAARAAVLIFVGWFLAVILLIVAYRFINPPFSMLMAQRFLTGTPVDNEWVPIERISPNLSRAVIVAEDGRFCSHWGVDFVEAMNAIKRASDGYPRGASTITMQMTKNLFLVPAKSYIRKVVEIPLTFVIEALWPKKRILEVYLNIVEWGPGIFGAEAASRAHFGRPASALTSRQAAQLAAVLPNPIIRDAGSPGPRTANKASVIQARAARTREASACIDGRR